MKLLVCDYDGTFYTDEDNVKKNVNKIYDWMKDGNYFMLSSGRSFNSLVEKIKKYGIPIDFISTEDGSYLFDHNVNLLHERKLDKKLIGKLDNIMNLNAHEDLQFGTKYEYYRELPKNDISNVNFVLKNNNISQKFIFEWNKLKENESNNYNFLVYSYDNISYYCIKPKGIDKTTPIKYLEWYIPILKKDIYTVGDSDNDKTMIEEYNGYVIGESPIRKYAIDRYDNVYELIDNINNKKIKKRIMTR